MSGDRTSAAQLSVIVNEMIEETRRMGLQAVVRDQPIRCAQGTYVLRGKASFKVAKPDMRSVWACDLARLDAPAELGAIILKTVFRQQADGAMRGPPREAKFYATLAHRAGFEKLRIPAHYGTNVQADGSVQLFIEHLNGLRDASSRAELHRAARTLGHFAGHCQAARLQACEWLPSGTLMPQFHHMTAFEQLLAWLPVGDGGRADILESYRRLLDRLADLNAAYSKELPTLCHGDLNQRNLLGYGHGFAAIDWETSNAGRVGDDLGRLGLRLLRETDAQTEEEDERLIAAYAAGAAPFFSKDPSDSIRRVYRLRLIIESMGEIHKHWRWSRNAPSATMRQERLHVLAQCYRRMAARAREALRALEG